MKVIFIYKYICTHIYVYTDWANDNPKKLWVHTIAYLHVSPKFIYILFIKIKINTWRKWGHDLMQLSSPTQMHRGGKTKSKWKKTNSFEELLLCNQARLHSWVAKEPCWFTAPEKGRAVIFKIKEIPVRKKTQKSPCICSTCCLYYKAFSTQHARQPTCGKTTLKRCKCQTSTEVC